MMSTEFWLYSMREPRARTALAERYRTMRRMVAELVASKAAQEGRKIAIEPEEAHAVIEAVSTGLMTLYLLAPDLVPPDLFGRVLRALLSPVPEAEPGGALPAR
jgi:hypothetical protein